MEKRCRRCLVDKDISEFYKNKRVSDGFSSHCKKCAGVIIKEGNRRRKLKLPSLQSERTREHGIANNLGYRASIALKRNYGINLKEYNELLNKQEGKCAICGKHHLVFKKRLHVDHNHKTGKIRGLLCSNCNSSIGKLYESVDLLENAIRYLKFHNFKNS